MGQTNIDANGFSPGNVSLNMPCGNFAGDGPNRTRNPIPTDAPTQSTINSAPITSNVSNPGVGVKGAGAGQPITVTGASGSTGNPATDTNRKVVGQVPNGPAFSNPA